MRNKANIRIVRWDEDDYRNGWVSPNVAPPEVWDDRLEEARMASDEEACQYARARKMVSLGHTAMLGGK